MKKKIILLLTICLSAIGIKAQTEAVKVPLEVKSFVESGTKAIALESADLNGDKLKDYILVLERENPTETDKYDYPADQRPLLVLVRGKDKKLSEAKRNEQIIMCSMCGGVWGDPFAGVTVGKNTFTVNHYGGSNWRWTADYRFNYSRIDKTWQLVRVEKTSFHTAEPNKTERKVMTPPKDFGKVDIADFNPGDYEEKQENEESDSSDAILIKIPDGNFTATAAGFIKEKGDAVKYTVNAEKGNRMKFSIVDVETPDEEGPVMIGYVTAPNGTEDGNFGGLFFDDVLQETGEYKIVIKQNEAKSASTNIKFKLKVELENEPKSGQNSKDSISIDVLEFNQKIAKASAANENWVKFPTQVLANWLPKFEEFGSRSIEMKSEFADTTDYLKTVVTDDNYADDSVRGGKYWIEIKKDSNGVWKIVSAKKAWVCRENRGHQDYSAAPCS